MRGIQYLHENGLIHGDIKPANILVFSETEVAIAVRTPQAVKALARRLGYVVYAVSDFCICNTHRVVARSSELRRCTVDRPSLVLPSSSVFSLSVRQDFDCSRPREPTGRTTTAMARYTREYAAPEVLDGELATVMTDLFAFGVSLAEVPGCTLAARRFALREFRISAAGAVRRRARQTRALHGADGSTHVKGRPTAQRPH